MARSLTLGLLAAASIASGQFEGWVENQVNASMCLWAQPRGAVIRDTVYLDGGYLYWTQGLSTGEYGPPEQQENPLGLIYTLNFSRPFQSSDNLTALFGTLSKARGGVGNTNNDAPNYYDGAMLVNDGQLTLYGGLVKKTDAFQPPRADDALTYQVHQYGPVRDQFQPGFVANRLPDGMTRYVAYGGAVSAPSENLAWYFGGLRAPNWGPVFQRNSNATENAVAASDTLLTLDSATQTRLVWANSTLPDTVRSRANPEVVWVPVGERGILVAIGGVTYPDWVTSTRRSANPVQSRLESDAFTKTVDVYDVANGTWYRQATSGGPAARTRACAVVAPAQDRSSFNIYFYGGYPGVDPKVEMSDDVWVLSVPSFTWTRVSEGRPGHGRSGHKCFMPYPDQMMVIGGMTSQAGDHLTCLSGLIQIYNLTSGQWMDSYDPEKYADYGVPRAVREVIGGSARGGATLLTPSPSGWSDDKLADIFATPYLTSRIQTWYPYPRSTAAHQPTSDSGGGDLPNWVAPVLGSALGLLLLAGLLGGFYLWRRRKRLRRGARSEYSGGARILSWIMGQPAGNKTLTLTTPSSSSMSPCPVPPAETMGTIAELPDTSPPPELPDNALDFRDVIKKHTKVGTSIQPTFYSTSASIDSRSIAPSSGVLGPESPHGVVSPVDDNMRWNASHRRQLSEDMVSPITSPGDCTSDVLSPLGPLVEGSAYFSPAAESAPEPKGQN